MAKKYSVVLLSLLILTVLSCTDNEQLDCCVPPPEKSPYDYFADISQIPRCTGSEQAISDYMMEFAASLGLDARQDTALNVLIRKPGSHGRENKPYVILQAHMDMVCKKDDDVDHDFETDPIIVTHNGDGWLTAFKRTTLGADNGGGVSVIMAVLASSVSHPPIEALFTADEESGLTGADKFDMSWLEGRRLINLDLTTEDMIVSSSTRSDSGIFIAMAAEPAALAKIRAYPDWHYRENSPLRDKMVEVYKSHYDRAPVFAAINVDKGAVECVSFAQRMPDLDQAAVGVNIENIHTPDERMELASHERLYRYIIKLLGAL